jgi:hypothetical protein
MVRPANGTEGAAWMAAWCRTCAGDANGNCPILLDGIIGNHPMEWRRGPMWSPQTAIFCVSYSPKVQTVPGGGS